MTRPCDHHGSASSVRCDRCGAPIGAGEASGLIDVRALAALMNAGPRRNTPVPHLGGLTAAPVAIAPTPAPARPVAAVTPAQLPLYYMLGALALGMMALATFIISRPAPPRVHVVTPPAVVAQAAARAEDPADEVEPEPGAVVAVEPVAAAEPVDEEQPVARPEPSRSARKSPRKPAASAPATPEPRPAAPAVATGPAADSVACLLKTAECAPKSAPKPEPKPAPVVSPPVSSTSLPEKLEPADISDGTRAVKAAAMDRCRALARGGEKVTIKLSIAGPEGTVVSTSPQDDAGNPQLAACCAGELARATFKKVQKAQIGAVATLKF